MAEIDELDSYYLNDQALEGECSEDENFVFMSTEFLEMEFEEADLSDIFAQFASVQRHKNNLKKARGFFEPQFPPQGQKGKKGKKGDKGKGKAKSKFQEPGGKGKARYRNKYQDQRDRRRHEKGIVRLPKKILVQKRDAGSVAR